MNKKWMFLALSWALTGLVLCAGSAFLTGFDGYRISGWPQLSFRAGSDFEMAFFSFPR